MSDLFRLQWDEFDAISGLKVVAAALLIFGLMAITGETWIATGLILLFAWLTNVPGPLKNRLAGMAAFAIAAIAVTWLSGQIALGIWPNTIAITVIGFLATFALAWGTRPYMVGYALICWATWVGLMYCGIMCPGSSTLLRPRPLCLRSPAQIVRPTRGAPTP